MNYPLWLIPVLPLAGCLLNGIVALISASSRARREAAAWRAAHPALASHDTRPIQDAVGHETHGDPAHVDTLHGDSAHGGHDAHAPAGLPYVQRLFHGIVGVVSVGAAAVLSFGVLLPYIREALGSAEGAAPVVETAYRWMAAGIFSVDVAFRLDALSAVMLSF